MTFFKKYMMLVVGGSIAGVLIIVAAVLLFKFRGEYLRVQSDLQSNLSRLERLHERVPFPSRENVQRVNANSAELESYLYGMLESLSTHQPMPSTVERAAFPSEMERTGSRLRQAAYESSVRLGTNIAFGFQRYSAGNLPMQEHVPRLMVQLRTIEALCQVLISSKVDELSDVEREVFDIERVQTAMEPAVMRRGTVRSEVVVDQAAEIEPSGISGLYTKERYTLTFFASDLAVRTVLNRLAENPMMIVVRNVELRNEMGLGSTTAAQRLSQRLQPRDAQRTATGMGMRPGATDLSSPQAAEDRVVAGRESVRVTMVLDVYRFEPPRDEEGGRS